MTFRPGLLIGVAFLVLALARFLFGNGVLG